MNRKLVLHIGLRKTGSSALQELFASNHDLLDAHGISYPDRLTRYPAHQELAWSLMDPPPPYFDLATPVDEIFDSYGRTIEANSENGRTTLLSSEDLSLLTFNFAALTTLRQWFGHHDPLVVFYARDPVAYHVSNYKHALVAGRETRSFSDYVFNGNSLMYAQPQAIRRIWASAFGNDNVMRLAYDPATFAKRSLFAQFLGSVFDVEIEDTFGGYTSNTGIADDAVNYVLALNRSELPDEEIRTIKSVIRKTNMVSSVDRFLDQHLSPEEKRIIARIHDPKPHGSQ